MPSIVTWNTQGNPLNDTNKRTMLTGLCEAFDIVLLQECGRFGEAARTFAGKHVCWTEQAGAFNARCSTAILAPRWEDSGLWTGSSTGRAGLWIRIDDLFVATIHCTSSGVGLTDLRPFAGDMARVAGDHAVLIGGDFNHEVADDPAELNAGTASRPVLFSVHTQGRATRHAPRAAAAARSTLPLAPYRRRRHPAPEPEHPLRPLRPVDHGRAV
ncbi:endonuclease/exonuclease/phosphatase family protein [Luteimonas sp. TWI1416]|uniref:endonuclease/exonuclease/phosphatase family protein n=1 Tax=unclassified Luteimonas TaxID=2629088 RepID=UPI00320873CA